MTLAVKPADAPRLVHGINEYALYAAFRGSEVKIDPESESATRPSSETLPVTILWDFDPRAMQKASHSPSAPTRSVLQRRRPRERSRKRTVAPSSSSGRTSAWTRPVSSPSRSGSTGPSSASSLRHRIDVTALSQALRSGVREVVTADDHTALADALRAQPS